MLLGLAKPQLTSNRAQCPFFVFQSYASHHIWNKNNQNFWHDVGVIWPYSIQRFYRSIVTTHLHHCMSVIVCKWFLNERYMSVRISLYLINYISDRPMCHDGIHPESFHGKAISNVFVLTQCTLNCLKNKYAITFHILHPLVMCTGKVFMKDCDLLVIHVIFCLSGTRNLYYNG